MTHANLADAERILLEELRDQSSLQFRLSPKQTRVRAAARRLEFDLLRYLRPRPSATAGSSPRSSSCASAMGDGRARSSSSGGLRVRGRIDRVDDVRRHGARDRLQERQARRPHKVASWEPENRFQAALYMLAVEKLLGLRAAGGVYVALGSRRPAPARDGRATTCDELGERLRSTPTACRRTSSSEKLDWARGRIRETAARMRARRAARLPGPLRWNGGCAYPSICRSER